MIVATDFRFDYGEVLSKALTGEQPAAPAAPAVAQATSPQPHGPTSQPRAGHKYVRRWWAGNGWQYEYPGESGHQHVSQAHFGDHARREHTLALPEGRTFGPGQEEHAYKQTLQESFKPGSVHQAPNPAGGDTPIGVQVLKNGKIRISDAAGNKLRDDLDSHGAYERWYRGVAMGPKEFSDPEGKPWLTVVPNLGKPVEGVLTPSTDPRQWVVKFADEANPEFVRQSGAGKRKDFRFVSKENALDYVKKLQQNIYLATGQQFGGSPTTAPAAAPSAATAVSSIAAAPAVQAQAQSQVAPATAAAQNHADPMVREIGKYGWKLRPDLKREFAGPPEVKERFVQQIAQQYSPQIMKLVSSAIKTNPDMAQNERYWAEKLLGGANIGEETIVTPEPGSIIHSAISRMVDNYDPTIESTTKPGEKVGLAAYIGSSLPKDMLQLVKQARDEAYGTTSMQSEQRGEAGAPAPDITTKVDPEAVAGTSYEGQAQRPETIESWRQMQEQRLYQLSRDKQLPQGFVKQAVDAIRRIRDDDQIDQFASVLQKFGHGEYLIDKSLHKLLFAMAQDMKKANGSGFITRDKNVDPSHQYSHREGDDDHPRFFFRDANGNYIRYTNGPSGHSDSSSRMGDPSVHSSEVTPDAAPQFFDPWGRKLTRAPVEGAQMQWNQNYHPQDPENLWVGRWVNPQSGQHEYSYVDSDMRMIPKLYLFQQNALVDVRLPVLRKYVRSLFASPMIKDKIVATALALLDQGRFRADELSMLTVADVVPQGSLYKIGTRLVYGDHKFRSMMSLLTRNRQPQEPLFAVPFVKKDGEVDALLIRRIGPHFLSCVLEQIGISLPALQTYHATQTFSREVQRLITESHVPWQSAIEYATVAVAQEMGHDLTQEIGMEQALPMIRELMIDPVVVEVLERNAKDLGVLGDAPIVLPFPPPPVAYVSFDLTTRSSDEEEFSRWLHGYPVHLHAEVQPPKPFQQAPVAQPQQMNPPNSPSEVDTAPKANG